MVEGIAATLKHDQLKHPIEILEDITCADAKRPNACIAEPCIAIFVHGRTVTKVVSCTIYFDAQPRLFAVEIENVGTRRVLLPELKTVRPLPQMLPQ